MKTAFFSDELLLEECVHLLQFAHRPCACEEGQQRTCTTQENDLITCSKSGVPFSSFFSFLFPSFFTFFFSFFLFLFFFLFFSLFCCKQKNAVKGFSFCHEMR